MKVGIEGNHTFNCREVGVKRVLDLAGEHRLDGVFFKTVLYFSPTLDAGALRDVRAYADERGLYLEVGLGRINPYNTAESPEIRRLGDGDYRRGFERMIAAAAAMGCTELLAGTGTWKDYPGRYAFDRFRTDALWADQLQATAHFLAQLAPCLRDHGCRIDVETHEEITSFEVVRLVESIGPDALGVTFDTGNVLARCEDPVAAARRVAPYVHLMHVKDAILTFDPHGLVRQPRACGEGIIAWETILPILHQAAPDLHLSLEDHRGFMLLEIYDPEWLAAHPDLTTAELAQVVRLAQLSEAKIARGEIMPPAAYDAEPWEEQRIRRLEASRDYLRALIAEQGLQDPTSHPHSVPAH
jgi:sugar phosphate isomerase/epimerase